MSYVLFKLRLEVSVVRCCRGVRYTADALVSFSNQSSSKLDLQGHSACRMTKLERASDKLPGTRARAELYHNATAYKLIVDKYKVSVHAEV